MQDLVPLSNMRACSSPEFRSTIKSPLQMLCPFVPPSFSDNPSSVCLQKQTHPFKGDWETCLLVISIPLLAGSMFQYFVGGCKESCINETSNHISRLHVVYMYVCCVLLWTKKSRQCFRVVLIERYQCSGRLLITTVQCYGLVECKLQFIQQWLL